MERSALTVAGSLVLAVCAMLTGCASSTTPAAGSAIATAGSSAGTGGSSAPLGAGSAALSAGGSSSGTSSPEAGDVLACGNADVTVEVGASGAGLGHVDATIVFINSSDHPCTLFGYPGVAGLDSAGREATRALPTLSGYLGGGYTEATVLLAPGGAASALVEGTTVPTGTATACPVYARLLVTGPDQTTSHSLAVSMPGCSLLQVHPVVTGAAGRE